MTNRSQSFSKALVSLLAFAVLGAWPAGRAMAETMSLDSCIRQAKSNWSLLKAGRHESAAKAAEKDALRGNFLPKLKVDSSFMIWDQKRSMLDAEKRFGPLLGQVGTVLGDLSPHIEQNLSDAAARQAYRDLSGALQAMSSPQGLDALQDSLLTHKKLTWTNTLTIAQPLSQLYQIGAGYKAAEEQAKSSREDERRRSQEVELSVAQSYYGLIAALRAGETTSSAIRQIEAIEKQVQSLLGQGLVERNALMKVQVQKADLKRALFSATMNEKLARATLNMLMGRAQDSALLPEMTPGLAADDEPLLATGLDKQKDIGLAARPDLRSAGHLQQAARYGKHAAIGAMLPELSAVFLYEYKKGLGSLAGPKTQYYGGLNLTWTFWEWGAQYYKAVAARETEAKAYESVKALKDSVRLEIENKRLQLEEAREVLAVTQAALREARENLRIEQSRYDAQQTTTTDLLQAQTLAVGAENNAIVAETRFLLARLALRSALGEDLV